MTYYFSKQLEMPFDQAITHVTEALAAKGFGVMPIPINPAQSGAILVA